MSLGAPPAARKQVRSRFVRPATWTDASTVNTDVVEWVSLSQPCDDIILSGIGLPFLRKPQVHSLVPFLCGRQLGKTGKTSRRLSTNLIRFNTTIFYAGSFTRSFIISSIILAPEVIAWRVASRFNCA